MVNGEYLPIAWDLRFVNCYLHGLSTFSSYLIICSGFPLQSFGAKIYPNLSIMRRQKDFRFNPIVYPHLFPTNILHNNYKIFVNHLLMLLPLAFVGMSNLSIPLF